MMSHVMSEHEALEFNRLISQYFQCEKVWKQGFLSMGTRLLQNYTLFIDLSPFAGLTVKQWCCNVGAL